MKILGAVKSISPVIGVSFDLSTFDIAVARLVRDVRLSCSTAADCRASDVP